MRRAIHLVFGVVLLGACGGGDYLEELMTQGEGMKERLCACTELACAQKVVDELAAWKKGLDEEKIKAAEEKATPEQRATMEQRMKAIGEGFDSCQEKWNDKGLRRPGH